MPTYTVDIPGEGRFRVESEADLTDDEAVRAVRAQQSQGEGIASPEREPGTYESFYGGEGFGGAVGRRFGSTLDAAVGLPGALADVVTGGRDGRLDAALRILQGVTSPYNIALAPIEAGVETAAKGVGVPEGWARLAGDITGVGATFGLGALAKAGVGGEAVQTAAKLVGAGRSKSFEEQVLHDPQMRYIAERPNPVGVTYLEELGRSDASMEELALALKRPEMSRMILGERAAEGERWKEWAKNNQIVGDVPDDPTMTIKNIVFGPSRAKDLNSFQMLGTPATRAAGKDPLAAAIAYETQLTEMGIQKGGYARLARTEKMLSELSDSQALQGSLLFTHKNYDDIMGMELEPVVKKYVTWLKDKFAFDSAEAVPRLRDEIREKVLREVKSSLPDATMSEQIAEVNRRLVKAYPDNMNAGDAVLQLHPGFWSVTQDGKVIGTFNKQSEWKNFVYDLVREGKADLKDLDVEAKAYLDTDTLAKFKGKTSKSLFRFADALKPTKEEIEAAAKGEYGFSRGFNWLETMFTGEDTRKSRGFLNDLKEMLTTFDLSFERWMQVNDLKERINPALKEVAERYPVLARTLKGNIDALWGHRMPGGPELDNLIAATPILRDIAAPMMLERWTRGLKTGMVSALLKFNPKFQAVNMTQTLQTLWPIADFEEIMQGIKLGRSEAGADLIARHLPEGSKIEGWAKGLGPAEKFNQETAFLTMYNRARKLGFSDPRAADYAKLRGNVYSQFLGLQTDQPIAFRKMDPAGLFFMFQRFPVKQTEMLVDLIKDKNMPGVAKWLGVNMALGGFKAATMGQVGWLTYKLYNDIEKEYGKPIADMFHVGLPGLLGADVSNSVQLLNPPFGETWLSKLGNFAAGPMVGIASSVVANALDSKAVDPSMTHRVLHTLADRNPLAKGLYQLFEDDKYDFRDPAGRLKFKGDLSDLMKTFLGFRPAGGTMGQTTGPNQMRPAELDTFIDAFMEANQKRNDVLDYAASRWGAAMSAGVDLGKDMKDMVKGEVDSWNNLWPELPITGEDILNRAQRRAQTARETQGQRVMQNMPAAIKNSPLFAPPPVPVPGAPVVPPPPPFSFGGG
jgi:hypothetical protein